MNNEVEKKIFVVNYGMGNLCSIVNAFKFLGANILISNRKEDLTKADALVLPGVGAFAKAMDNLKNLSIIDVLTQKVIKNKIPFLGICLGMQLIAEDSEEDGYHKGLGWISGNVRKIRVKKGTRLPHIGWNDINICKIDPLFRNIKNDFDFYFVHSFHVECEESYISAKCKYDVDITASLQKDNIFATQFHPEKSQENGLKVLREFINYVQNH